jgi:hypothetical protein
LREYPASARHMPEDFLVATYAVSGIVLPKWLYTVKRGCSSSGNGLLLSFDCSAAVGNCREDNMPVKLKVDT